MNEILTPRPATHKCLDCGELYSGYVLSCYDCMGDVVELSEHNLD